MAAAWAIRESLCWRCLTSSANASGPFASSICLISAGSFGRPPGLPLIAALAFLESAVGHLFQPCSEVSVCDSEIGHSSVVPEALLLPAACHMESRANAAVTMGGAGWRGFFRLIRLFRCPG